MRESLLSGLGNLCLGLEREKKVIQLIKNNYHTCTKQFHKHFFHSHLCVT